MASKTCLVCGKEFYSSDSRVSYCCPSHRFIGSKHRDLYIKLQKAQRLAIQAKKELNNER